MAINALAALIAFLKADSTVAAAVGNVTVYEQTVPAITAEIDDEWAKAIDGRRRVVLVRESGNSSPPETDAPIQYPRLDIRCYGADPGGVYDASELSRIVYERLHGRQDCESGIGSIIMVAGPTPGRDPDTEWAYNLRTYDVLAEG